MYDLYGESYKTLMKDIKEDMNKWEKILCFWIGKLSGVFSSKRPQTNLQI